MADYEGKLTGKQIDELPARIKKVEDDLGDFAPKVGDLDKLDDDVKSDNLVSAINKAAKQGGIQEKVEQVIVRLTNDFGVIAWRGKNVVVTEQGEDGLVHNLELDENGYAVTYIKNGTEYTVTFPTIEGYNGSEPLTFVSQNYIRNVDVRYHKVYNDLRDVARSFVVEASSSPHCEVTGSEEVVDRILSHGSFVIDETNKKYARLSETDSNVFEDGTPWNGAYGNAFRYLPPIYILHDKDYADAGVKYWVSDQPFSDAKMLPESWIGMYKGSVINGILRSIPNVVTTESKTMSDFWACARQGGVNYGLVNYFDHQKLNALHLAKFGNMNSDDTVGIGLCNAGQGYQSHRTGTTASLGNRTGVKQYLSTQFNMVRLFGVEDLFGTSWEFRPNIRFDNGNAIIYEGNIVSDTEPGVRIFGRLQTVNQAYIKNMALGDNFDLIAIDASGGSAATYWCDGTWAASTGHLLIVGGSSADGSAGGLSCSASSSRFSISGTHIGARLAFKGNINDYKEIGGAELAALHM